MAYPQRMATEWTAAMVAALPDDGNRYEVLDGEFASRRLLEPDVFVVPRTPDGPRPRSFADARRLLLAIEVLSPSTARRDAGSSGASTWTSRCRPTP